VAQRHQHVGHRRCSSPCLRLGASSSDGRTAGPWQQLQRRPRLRTDREWEREDGPAPTFAVAADGAAQDAGLVDGDDDYGAEEVATNDCVSVCSVHEDRPS